MKNLHSLLVSNITAKSGSTHGFNEILSTYKGSQYIGQVGVGQPPQSLKVLFDSGSSNFWLRPQTLNHHGFFFVASKSLIMTDSVQHGWFHAGHVKGLQVYDDVSLGELALPAVPIFLALGSGGEFGPFEGIVGLAPGSTSGLLAQLRASQALKANTFRFKFEDEFGFVEFAPTVPHGAAFLPQSRAGFWSAAVGGLRVNGLALEVCSEGCDAIFDSGTSIIMASPNIAVQLSEALNSAVDCTDLTSEPTLSLSIGGTWLQLQPRDLFLFNGQTGECTAVVSWTDALPRGTILLGALFLRAFDVFFDFQVNQVAVFGGPAVESSD